MKCAAPAAGIPIERWHRFSANAASLQKHSRPLPLRREPRACLPMPLGGAPRPLGRGGKGPGGGGTPVFLWRWSCDADRGGWHRLVREVGDKRHAGLICGHDSVHEALAIAGAIVSARVEPADLKDRVRRYGHRSGGHRLLMEML